MIGLYNDDCSFYGTVSAGQSESTFFALFTYFSWFGPRAPAAISTKRGFLGGQTRISRLIERIEDRSRQPNKGIDNSRLAAVKSPQHAVEQVARQTKEDRPHHPSL